MKEVERLEPRAFTKFCMSIAQVPSSYIAGLTIEEQLLWFCSYLEKTVIPAVNNNAEAVTELQNLYVQLKDYVDNYFDNLDVQEEINNKLDAMVEDGTLEELITQYVQLQGVLGYDNLAALKAAENLVEGSFVRTYGYYTYNDGGEAFYKVRQVTNQDTEDDAYIVALHDENLVAELMIGEKINVKQVGAKGNGTDDDITAINKALEKIDEYPIYFPKGNYLVSSSIIMDYSRQDYVNFDCSDATITYTGSDYAFVCSGMSYSRFKFGKIVALSGGCIKWHAETGDIDGNWSQYNEVSFVELKALTNCFYVTRTNGWITEFSVTGGQVTSGAYGIYMEIDSTTVGSSINGFKFYNVGIEGVTNGIKLDAHSNNISNIYFLYPRTAEFYQSQYEKLLTTVGNVDSCVFDSYYVFDMDKTTISATTNYFKITGTARYRGHGTSVYTTYKGGTIIGGLFVANDNEWVSLNGYKEIIPSNTDLNTINMPGGYSFENIYSCTNKPNVASWESDYGGRMFVMSMSPRYDGLGTSINVMQLLISGGGRMFMRYIHGTSAGSWVEFAPLT